MRLNNRIVDEEYEPYFVEGDRARVIANAKTISLGAEHKLVTLCKRHHQNMFIVQDDEGKVYDLAEHHLWPLEEE